MLRVLSLAVALLAIIAGQSTADTFNVTASGAVNYTINSLPDPPLNLRRGRTYTFNINAPGHPFRIKTAPGSGTGNSYNDGVTGNGTSVGTLVFTVPLSAPSTLFYNCEIHAQMSGTINVLDAVPGLSPVAIGLLLLLVITAGALVLRRRVLPA